MEEKRGSIPENIVLINEMRRVIYCKIPESKKYTLNKSCIYLMLHKLAPIIHDTLNKDNKDRL
jgi:hypothetical protein